MNESSAKSEMSHGVASIPFSKIPGQSKLFLDYLSDPESLRQFYPNAVASHHELVRRVPDVLNAHKTPRDRLAKILREQQAAFGGSDVTFKNVELLSEADSVAIVTGQQAGLFSGPIYTVYKALSAIKLAECLRGRGVKAVPVFWVATEDHDFEEVATVSAIGADGFKFDIANRPKGYVDDIPVGAVEVDDSISRDVVEMSERLENTRFSETVISLLQETYRPGESFGTAFCRLMSRLFAKYGLVAVDPIDPRIKELAGPMIERSVSKVDELVRCLLKRDEELTTAGYDSQVLVKPDHVPFFWLDDKGKRRTLRRERSGRFGVAESKIVFTAEELIEIARREPARLSAGALLRPVVQDYLFPTLCYFGGGAEIAYFAQNSEVYRVLDRPATTIFHRQSFTVVEAKHRRTLAKFGLDFLDLFDGADALVPRIVDNYIDPQGAKTFAEAEENVNAQLDLLGKLVARLDQTLTDNLAKRRRKIIYHLTALKTKFARARLRKDAEVDRRINAAVNTLVPGGLLQERSLNVFYFLNKFGLEFIDEVYAVIDLDDRGHRVVDI